MKNRKGGRNCKKAATLQDMPLVFADGPEQSYGIITALLGDGRFRLVAADGHADIIGIARGAIRKRHWITVGSIVLFSYRSFQSDKVDIFHVYEEKDHHNILQNTTCCSEFMTALNGSVATGGGYDDADTDIEFDYSRV